jgi:hypothetical protein
MKNIIFLTQGVIQLLVSLGALICGTLLIIVPSSALLQLPPDMLKDAPFNDFLIPGIILFVINGIGQLVAGILTVRRHPRAGLVGATFGLALMIWIFVQVNMIGGRNILQYSYFFVGTLETALAFLIHRYPSGRSVQP